MEDLVVTEYFGFDYYGYVYYPNACIEKQKNKETGKSEYISCKIHLSKHVNRFKIKRFIK